ncbi:MAG: hypothetical protein U9N06_03800 [candidate division WOR-3 bacterium]|nr:hypothetical protein [candidate division WOR-3 bacterium]
MKLSLKILGAISNGSHNLFTDSLITGKAIEGEIIYESHLNRIEGGVRKVSERFLTLGDSYLITGRSSTFINGNYEKKIFYTDFDHLLYIEEGNIGFSLVQTLKLNISDYFSPLLEYQWGRYPEYKNEVYQYVGLGFESNFDYIRFYNIFGVDRYKSIDTTTSFKLSSFISFYPSFHSISIGSLIANEKGMIRFGFNLDANLKLWDIGYLDISYNPFIEEGYGKHLLRIIYEYGF